MSMKFAAGCLLAGMCLVVDLVVGVGPARATYPGVNGRLAFGIDTGDGNFNVYTVKPDGEALRQLTTSPFLEICAAYSPNGKSIAYCRGEGASFEIWAMKANGKQQHQVTHTGGRMLSSWSMLRTAAGSSGSPPIPAWTGSRRGLRTARRLPSSATAPACSRCG